MFFQNMDIDFSGSTTMSTGFTPGPQSVESGISFNSLQSFNANPITGWDFIDFGT